MMVLVFILVAFLCASVVAASFNEYTLTKYNVFAKTPQNKEQIQTGGRLIERHLAYLQEAGYKSILSVVVFATNDTVYNGVEGDFPASDYEMQLAASYGLTGQYIASNLTVESAQEISKIMASLPRPLYVHCHVGYTANLFTQLHLYLQGSIGGAEIYAHSLSLGYDYRNNSDVVSLINSLTQRSDTPLPERFEHTLANGEASFKSYYWTHRLGDSDYYYNAGQFLDTHTSAISTAGYTTVISFRADQEATTRISSDPATGAVDNHEFSDDAGLYSVKKEETAFTTLSPPVDFVHLPLYSDRADTWTKATFDKYLPILKRVEAKTIEQNGAILVHCASGYRSAAFTLTFLAHQQGKCSDWVMQKAEEVGFVFSHEGMSAKDVDVVNFVYDVLQC